MRLVPADDAGLAQAAALLRSGEVVAFPTDTVYGLGAQATDPLALRRVYEVKGRPLSRPLVLMVAAAEQVDGLAHAGGRERRFMERWWPGPLTLVLPAHGRLRPPLTTGKPRTVAVRIPDHPVALKLLRAVGAALATTSANRSGEAPALTPLEAAWLPGLGAVVDGGRAPGGVPSTVLDLTGPEPRVLREGAVPAEELVGR